ncbi:MAG: hypothetical protein KKE17_02830 [Proteobacteria bacterium]|nr:hypothetical protein [Pseudomonadota bacterium]MBU1708917.1 hypothetical protein [Pseudomonadota bacterium]
MTVDSNNDHPYSDVLRNLRTFIEFSLQADEKSWSEWIAATAKSLPNKCWEKKQCHEANCPAYNNECGRCWLIAGTMCGGDVQGKFAKKYLTCVDCDVFQEFVLKHPGNEMQEHILILIHSLRSKQLELKEALNEVKTLSGIIPICMSCKKIRDDKDYWNQLEVYISEHTDARFSHGICPDCLKRDHPRLFERRDNKPDV